MNEVWGWSQALPCVLQPGFVCAWLKDGRALAQDSHQFLPNLSIRTTKTITKRPQWGLLLWRSVSLGHRNDSHLFVFNWQDSCTDIPCHRNQFKLFNGDCRLSSTTAIHRPSQGKRGFPFCICPHKHGSKTLVVDEWPYTRELVEKCSFLLVIKDEN